MPEPKSLASVLRGAVDRRARALQRHHSASPGAKKFPIIAKLLNDVVHLLVVRGQTLLTVTSRSPAAQLLPAFLESEDGKQFAFDHLEVATATVFACDTDQMAARCLQLARLVIADTPTDAVQSYLSRLSRCYIAGFYAETFILARAVLEIAVRDRFVRHRVPLPRPQDGESRMKAWMREAENRGWLTAAECADAEIVWDRGGSSAHRGPGDPRLAYPTMETTLELLRRLCNEPVVAG